MTSSIFNLVLLVGIVAVSESWLFSGSSSGRRNGPLSSDYNRNQLRNVYNSRINSMRRVERPIAGTPFHHSGVVVNTDRGNFLVHKVMSNLLYCGLQ